jgi:hypothetical protein
MLLFTPKKEAVSKASSLFFLFIDHFFQLSWEIWQKSMKMNLPQRGKINSIGQRPVTKNYTDLFSPERAKSYSHKYRSS